LRWELPILHYPEVKVQPGSALAKAMMGGFPQLIICPARAKVGLEVNFVGINGQPNWDAALCTFLLVVCTTNYIIDDEM
jgi:hypothetical protein